MGADGAPAADRVTYLQEAARAAARYLREETYTATRRPVEEARTLLPDAYRDPAFHALEQERLFTTSWVGVAFADRVAETGQVATATVADQPIMITRDPTGALRAFHNVCRHRGTQLVEADTRVKRFRCPYHSWTYALDGELLGAPLFEGSDIPDGQQAVFDTSHARGFRRSDHGLLPVRVERWAHLVFVNLEGRARPLAEWLGDLPERLRGYRLEDTEVVAEQAYDVAANWKLAAENYMEYYHLPWVHPELVKTSRVEDHHRFQGPGMYCGMTTSPLTRDTEGTGWSSLPPVPGLDDGDANAGRFVWLFPNVALAVLPNHVFTILARPDGPARTVETTAISLHRAASRVADAGALKELERFWDVINREDIDVIERVQRGLASRAFPGGPMCYRFEEPVHRFQNMVIDRMVGIDRIPPGDERGDTPMFA
jgi:choline monooxygenase